MSNTLIFRPAVIGDSELILAMINGAYAISEKEMWKEGTVRTTLDEVTLLGSKTFLDQDTYLVGIDSEDEIVCVIRYEPKLIVSLQDEATTLTQVIRFVDLFPSADHPNLHKMLSESTEYTPSDQRDLPSELQSLVTLINDHAGVWDFKTIGHFSQFVVNPFVQGSGFGFQLLQHIELLTSNLSLLATSVLHADGKLKGRFNPTAVMEMIVLSPRTDMIKYYSRHGYCLVQTLPPDAYMFADVLPQFGDFLMLEYGKDVTKKQ